MCPICSDDLQHDTKMTDILKDKMKSHSLRAVEIVVKPFQEFVRLEASGGILLLIAAIVAIVWSNSSWAASYFHLFSLPFEFGVGEWSLSKPISLWINDGLMAVFFLLVGLEIKRELLSGELSDPRQAAFPVFAAVGGMVLPAIIYLVVNTGGEGSNGWGIPMATDIAFALGILALVGRGIPVSLKIFLTAYAIIDDLGAILVIAVFYSQKLALTYLLWAGVLLVLLYTMGRLGTRKLFPYVLIGFVIWFLFLKSGIHATVAGVLLAIVIPHGKGVSHSGLLKQLKQLVSRLSFNEENEKEMTTSLLHEVEALTSQAQSPLSRLEHNIHPWVSFLIMPVFALANAGVSLSGTGLNSLTTPVGMGIIVGLIVGKQLGVLGFAWLGVKTRLANLPPDITWKHIYGTAILGGVGFTMSLFINSLAFQGQLAETAKLAILAASAINGIGGYLILKSARTSA